MKRLFYILTIYFFGMSLLSCQENDRLLFTDDSAIYFTLPTKDTTLLIQEDTVVYSFALETHSVYTLRLPIESTGLAPNRERTYKISINPSYTTAVEGTDFEGLKTEYHMPANRGLDTVSFTVHRTLPMQTAARTLRLDIVPTADFKEGIQERTSIYLKFSDILERPVWWDKWEFVMGEYGRKKHDKWLEIWGKSPLPTDVMMIHPFYTPKELMAIQDLRLYFERNEVYENGKRVTVPKMY